MGYLGEKNGTGAFPTSGAKSLPTVRGAPTIGCLALIEPIFFAQQDWIPVDIKDYRSIVVGKTMDTTRDGDRQLWEQVQERLAHMNQQTPLMLQLTQTIKESPEQALQRCIHDARTPWTGRVSGVDH